MFNRFKEIQERRSRAEGDEQGFTLIELLIVILVLGILAAIVIFALGGVTGQSASAACQTDARSVQTAIAAYEASATYNPANPPTGGATGNLVPTYLESWPNNASHYTISIQTANGVSSVYVTSAAAGSTAKLYTGADNGAACSNLS